MQAAVMVAVLRASVTAAYTRASVPPPFDLRAYAGRFHRESNMTVCPIAIVAGCRKCPAFTVCPLKTVIGDQVKEEAAPKSKGASGGKQAKKGR